MGLCPFYFPCVNERFVNGNYLKKRFFASWHGCYSNSTTYKSATRPASYVGVFSVLFASHHPQRLVLDVCAESFCSRNALAHLSDLHANLLWFLFIGCGTWSWCNSQLCTMKLGDSVTCRLCSPCSHWEIKAYNQRKLPLPLPFCCWGSFQICISSAFKVSYTFFLSNYDSDWLVARSSRSITWRENEECNQRLVEFFVDALRLSCLKSTTMPVTVLVRGSSFRPAFLNFNWRRSIIWHSIQVSLEEEPGVLLICKMNPHAQSSSSRHAGSLTRSTMVLFSFL